MAIWQQRFVDGGVKYKLGFRDNTVVWSHPPPVQVLVIFKTWWYSPVALIINQTRPLRKQKFPWGRETSLCVATYIHIVYTPF
jgi:hypothetical protein